MASIADSLLLLRRHANAVQSARPIKLRADPSESTPMPELYDEIGHGYQGLRIPEPRIESRILDSLGSCQTVVNVGAGAGSYEPRDRFVVPVEPSSTMIANRSAAASRAVRATATGLPFRDDAFEAALAVLTVHHWPDRLVGLREISRVANDRVVILTWDPASPSFWLADYFPEILSIDRAIFPSLSELRRGLGECAVSKVPIPADCSDGFLGAYWKRPEAYLSSEVRAAISTFTKLAHVEAGLRSLERDLQTGEWRRRYESGLDVAELDLGYRLIVARNSFNDSSVTG